MMDIHKVFWEIHSDNPQEGPGNFASTRKAFQLMQGLPDRPRILDIGCGPGRQTLDLARLTDGHITAFDFYAPFVKRLQRELTRWGLRRRVKALKRDMTKVRFPPGSFDVIWTEGSLYFLGFEKGLAKVRRFLRPGGFVAVSELTWLRKGAPKAVRSFYKEGYPAMQDVSRNLAAVRRAGYDVISHFTLPEAAWWAYFNPIRKKLPALKRKYRDDPAALEVLAGEDTEIGLYRKHSRYYGYEFFVARRRD